MECTSARNAQLGVKTISGSPEVKPPISSVVETSYSQSKDNVVKTEEIVPSQKKYCKISNEKRLELISSVENNGQTVKAAAERLSINYSSAKSIYNIYKKEGRSNKKGFRNLAAGKKDPKTQNLEPNHSTTQPTVQSDSNECVSKSRELKEQPVKTLLGKREHPDCPSDEKMTNPQFSNSSNNNNNQASCLPFNGQTIPNCSNFPQPPQVHQGQQFNFGMPVMMVQQNGFYGEKNNQNKQEFRCDNGNNMMMICNPQQNNMWHQVQPLPQSFMIISSEPQPQHFVLKPIEQWPMNQPNQVNNVHQQNQSMNMANCSSMQTVTTFYPNQTLQINHSSQKVEQFQYPNMMVAQSNNTQVQSGNYIQSVVTMVPINSNVQGQQNNFVPGFSMPNKEFAKNNDNFTTVNVSTSQDYSTR